MTLTFNNINLRKMKLTFQICCFSALARKTRNKLIFPFSGSQLSPQNLQQ